MLDERLLAMFHILAMSYVLPLPNESVSQTSTAKKEALLGILRREKNR